MSPLEFHSTPHYPKFMGDAVFIEVDGAKLYYTEVGAGNRDEMLHHLTSFSRRFLGSVAK